MWCAVPNSKLSLSCLYLEKVSTFALLISSHSSSASNATCTVLQDFFLFKAPFSKIGLTMSSFIAIQMTHWHIIPPWDLRSQADIRSCLRDINCSVTENFLLLNHLYSCFSKPSSIVQFYGRQILLREVFFDCTHNEHVCTVLCVSNMHQIFWNVTFSRLNYLIIPVLLFPTSSWFKMQHIVFFQV